VNISNETRRKTYEDPNLTTSPEISGPVVAMWDVVLPAGDSTCTVPSDALSAPRKEKATELDVCYTESAADVPFTSYTPT
jgi:hypothetical protein